MVSSPFTQVLHNWKQGDKSAEGELYHIAYTQLRRLAEQEQARNASKYGDSNPILNDSIHSTTALVHEAYLRLSQTDLDDVQHRRDFYLKAAKIMRQILIDHARHKQAQKRQPVTLLTQGDRDSSTSFEQLVIMDKTLDTFSARYPRQSNALKLKYLIGMKVDEISELLECSRSLIEKDLKFALCWFQSRLS